MWDAVASLVHPVGLEQLEPRHLLSAGPWPDGPTESPDSGGAGSAEILPLPLRVTTSASEAPLALPTPLGAGPSNAGYFGPESASAHAVLGLDRFRADQRFAGVAGVGYTSVIIDTGINRLHPFFGTDANGDGTADRIVYQWDFADNDADASDRNGHGSNVASIVGGSHALYGGVAPGAGIIALKVFGDNGSGSFSTVEKALQWVLANGKDYNVVSVNLSLGDGGNHDAPQARYGIGDELAALAAQNIFIAAAAGNSYFSFGSQQGLAYPAADPSVFAVGATYTASEGGFTYGTGARAWTTGAGRITPFSQRHERMTALFAPGAPISGAGATGAGLVAMHGTSQASPMVAGLAVLAQSLASTLLERTLTLAELSSVLVDASSSVVDGDDEDDNVVHTDLTFRLADAYAMGEAIWAMRPQTDPAPDPTTDPGSDPPPDPAPNPTPDPGMGTPTPNQRPILHGVRLLPGRAPVGVPVEISFRTLLRYTDVRDADGDTLSFRIATITGGLLMFQGDIVQPDFIFEPDMTLTFIAQHGEYGPREVLTIAASDGTIESQTLATVSVVAARPPLTAQSLPGSRSDATSAISATLPELRSSSIMATSREHLETAAAPAGTATDRAWWRTAPVAGPLADWNPSMSGLAAGWRTGSDWRL
ncbi:MAG: S8 family serine peptidase [Phycisphaerales bacterium]|nr:S8 family serine peptidase [Phycisphaerales bacterium]